MHDVLQLADEGKDHHLGEDGLQDGHEDIDLILELATMGGDVAVVGFKLDYHIKYRGVCFSAPVSVVYSSEDIHLFPNHLQIGLPDQIGGGPFCLPCF